MVTEFQTHQPYVHIEIMWPTENRRQPAQSHDVATTTKGEAIGSHRNQIYHKKKKKKRKERIETDLYWLFYTDSSVQEALIDPGGHFARSLPSGVEKKIKADYIHLVLFDWITWIGKERTLFAASSHSFMAQNTPEDGCLVSTPNQDFWHVTVMLAEQAC